MLWQVADGAQTWELISVSNKSPSGMEGNISIHAGAVLFQVYAK